MSASGHPHPAFESAAAAIVTAGRRLGARRLINGADGNLSVRLGLLAVAITPAGRRKDQLEPADVLAVALQAGDEAAGDLRWRPSSGRDPRRRVRHRPLPGPAARTPPPIRRRP